MLGHKGKKASVELIAAFLPSLVVESLYTVTDMNGLEVASLTLEPIAAMNVIIPPEVRLINIALVDIGAGTTDIAISQQGSIVAYAMATIAGDEITEEIIQKYLVDFETAEQIKVNSYKEQIVQIGREVIAHLKAQGVHVLAMGDEADALQIAAVDADAFCREAQMVLVIGGDGTMLRAARTVYGKEILRLYTTCLYFFFSSTNTVLLSSVWL